MKKYDTAIIGGGLAGLIAAIELAKDGNKVVVLEKSGRLGGRAITNKKNGVSFNLGGHALYRAGKAYSILQELGVHIDGGAPSSKVNAIWNNQILPMPASPMSMLSSKLLSWSGKMTLLRMVMKLNKIDLTTLSNSTLRDWAEGEIPDPMVRHIFYALCRTATYTHDPDYQLAGPVLAQVQRSLKGVLYLHGGWQTIVDQLHDKAVQAGVHIVSGKDVKEIVHQDGKVHKLKLADEEYLEISNVISTASASETYKLVRDADHTVLKRWKDEARPSKAACLDLGLKKLPVRGRDIAIALDQPIFFSHHTFQAKLSDDGTLVVHLVKYNGPGESDPKADEQMLTATMNTLHPGWEREVVARQFLPNITVVHDYMHIGKSDRLTGPAVQGIRGLYVAGDWVSHGEMLVDASAASARRAAEAILKESHLT